MKYYLIAGEASGDLHGSNLVKALKEEDSAAVFRSWGGDLMQQAGGGVVKHIRELAFMGFLEVVKNLPTILQNFKTCKKNILAFQPDVLILIDYPGFNLRMAKWAYQQDLRVFYYISPQLWAWHSSRANSIKKHVERLFVILPFEKDFYKKYDYEVDFVGHPLLDVTEIEPTHTDFKKKNHLSNKPIIALLPGSRRQEIIRMLRVMLAIVPQFPDYQFVIAGAPAMPRDFYAKIIGDSKKTTVSFIENQTYALLRNAKAALVTSGTATLETALFEVPQVVCYQGNAFSFWLAKQLVNVPYISLVNLIAEKEVVKELIQDELTESTLVEQLNRILHSETSLAQIREDYRTLKIKLGTAGASKKAAKLMTERLLNLQS